MADVVDLSSFKKKKEERASQEEKDSTKLVLLEPEEYQKIIESFIETSGDDFTEEEVVTVVTWAEEAALGATLLELVLAGEAGITLVDGKVAFVAHGEKEE